MGVVLEEYIVVRNLRRLEGLGNAVKRKVVYTTGEGW